MNQKTWGGMTAEEMSYNIWRGSTRTGEVCFPRWKDLSPRQRKSWAEALTAARLSGIDEGAKVAKRHTGSKVWVEATAGWAQ